MQVQRFIDANQFYQRVKDYLLNQEALHNLLLGMCNDLMQDSGNSEELPYLATVVYTPPKYSCRGYASATVAALSQYLLNQENQFCFLLTDLANPISNHIYQDIGYQPVGDWHQYSFS